MGDCMMCVVMLLSILNRVLLWLFRVCIWCWMWVIVCCSRVFISVVWLGKLW